MDKNPPKLAKANLPDNLKSLVETAKKLYQEKLAYFAQTHKPPAFIVAAPGRVNLIGEHTDYTGGFVLPLAVSNSTVVYGTGFMNTGKGTGKTTLRVRMVSDKIKDGLVEERRLTAGSLDPPDESEPRTWATYVLGTIAQYMPDLPIEGSTVEIAMAFAGDVPLGAGLSSSGALEVATACFLECFMKGMAFSSVPETGADLDVFKERALRCQKAENEWAHVPCGIMDPYSSSAGKEGHLMLIDCHSLELTHVPMKVEKDSSKQPVILVTDSKVEHSIADSEYGLRRAQCQHALEAMQQVPLYHVLSLRDATLQDVKTTYEKGKMDEFLYKRAKHVVTENQRTLECKTALKLGVWSRVGELMNASHTSLRVDFEVSCEELDFLVEKAQHFEGVFGSRMTGGGFGGCTVTLVERSKVDALVEELKKNYKEKFDRECTCFITEPCAGARVLAIDMDCKPESDFFNKESN